MRLRYNHRLYPTPGQQQALARGSHNRDKARLKVARAHAKVADARRDFHHQLSTALIRDN